MARQGGFVKPLLVEIVVNETLPIEGFRDQIIGSSAPYLIVEADTGAGKTVVFIEIDVRPRARPDHR